MENLDDVHLVRYLLYFFEDTPNFQYDAYSPSYFYYETHDIFPNLKNVVELMERQL